MASAPSRGSGRYYSISSVQTYERCPKAFWFGYVVHQEVPERSVPSYMRFGSVVHQGLEWAFKYMVENDLTGSLSQARDAALAGVRTAWVTYDMPPTGGELDRALGMVDDTLDVLEVPEPGSVLGVEYRLEGATDDGVNFIGYCDLFLRIGPNQLLIRDWKVTSKVKSPDLISHSFQLLMYAWASRLTWPWVEEVYVEEYYPPINAYTRVLLDADLVEDALARFEAAVEEIEGDAEFEPRPSEDCQSCPYNPFCPATGSIPPEQINF